MPECMPTTEGPPLVAISMKAEGYAEWVLRDGGGYQLVVPGTARPLDGVSGVLLTGGEDVSPTLYGEVSRCSSRVNPERDKFELELLQDALSRDLPILAVCRGMQLLTVALGGCLHQDLSELVSDSMPCERVRHRGPGYTDTTHPVCIVPNTMLAGCVDQQRLMVNSHHHQGIRELPGSLRISARSLDGLIEAVEHTGKTCVLGIQWHPERWPDKCSDAIMKEFLAACEHYRSRHTNSYF
jgi:putative glutamine amidotransferase